jgi:membrane associated rhomboid family serine protease
MYERRINIGFGGTLAPIVKKLLIINVAVFLIQFIFRAASYPLEPIFALIPYDVIHHFTVWQLVTYAFLHGSFFHIFFNMFALWMFGGDVERVLSSDQFMKFYFITAIGAGIVQMVSNWGDQVIILGASGAIYGVLVAFAVFYPNRVITLLLFFIIPIRIKAKYMVTFFVGLSLFFGIEGHFFGVSGGTAHFAHLGGALIGFLYLRWQHLLGITIREIRWRQEKRRLDHSRKKERDREQVRQRVDQILDKINNVGMHNISEEERKFLKNASDYLSED